MDNDENWHIVAESHEIADGSARELLVAGRIVAIFRHHGKLFALDGICAHQGGPLAEGFVNDGCVTCPWHGWQFELDTGTHTISQRPLAETFPIRERDGNVEVAIQEAT